MTDYIQFKTVDGDTFVIEVDGNLPEELIAEAETPEEVDAWLGDTVKEWFEGKIPQSKETFEDALDVVESNAKAFIRKIKDFPLADRPDEVQMSFGLKASGELGGSFVVAKAGIEAGYTVTLTWKNEQKKSE